MDRKGKMLLLMVFKVFLKSTWKGRKLKFNRLLHDIRGNSLLKRRNNKKKACFYFRNLFKLLINSSENPFCLATRKKREMV